MLTVMREMAAGRPRARPHARPRLGPDAAPEQNAVIAEILERAIAAGRGQSVKRGPELLPVLREAGVVDAGGYGVTIIFAGIVAALRGAEPPELEHHARRARHPPRARVLHLPLLHELRGHRPDLDPHAFMRAARADRRHRAGRRRRSHAQDPRPHRRARAGHRALRRRRRGLAPRRGRHARAGRGALRAPARRNGHGVPTQRAARSPSARDRAWPRCSRASACRRSTAAPTLNPSTYDLLAGIHAVAAEQVVVLPNSPNVFMAAERAASSPTSRSASSGRAPSRRGWRPRSRC